MSFRRESKMKLVRSGTVAAAVVLAASLAGCSHHESAPPQTVNPTPTPVANNPAPPAAPAQPAHEGVVVYKLAQSGDNSNSGSADANGLVATPVAMPQGSQSPARTALTDLASGPDSPLPPGTKVLGVKIDAADKLATVDFSKEFQANFQGGETHEAQAVNSVLETLGQFPSVQRVQILVNGRKIDSLGGTVEIDEPLPTPQSNQQLASSDTEGK